MIVRHALLYAVLVAGVAAVHAAPSVPTPASPAAGLSRIQTGPAIGWVFPLFSDKEGYRLWTLRGTEARIISQDQIDVTDFSAVVFSGDASERVDTILLSPQATFFPKDNKARGNSAVRLILSGQDPGKKDDIEVTGRVWTYDHTAKKVSLAHDVRVTFHAQLNDILK